MTDFVGDDEPLPLNEIKDRISDQTYEWLRQAELREEIDRLHLAEESPMVHIFRKDGSCSDEDDEHRESRVQTWTSSRRSADGFGGFDTDRNINFRVGEDSHQDDAPGLASSCITVQYVLSPVAGGHGDSIWAASRHIANQFAVPEKCRQILSPLLTDVEHIKADVQHPLFGLNVLELGAGGGLPSWVAMWCGANVVCTDQAIAPRIRCLAESAERNLRAIIATGEHNNKYVPEVRVSPYNWGESTDQVTFVLDKDRTTMRFEIILAADCIYIPDYHWPLLVSIDMLLSQHGVALLPFALHGNTSDEKVWSILDLAKGMGFKVEKLEPLQLTPQSSNMDAKRGFVHTIRLTRA